MPIPHRDRVIYGRNPLQEVVCQIRFPRLLDIDAEVPARFQSAIAEDYPLLAVRSVFQLTVDPGSPQGNRIKSS